MEPFLFRSYFYCVKGQATDVKELESEMKRLNAVDRGCVQWHFNSGHITEWLTYIGEKNLAKRVSNAKNLDEAIKIVSMTASRRRSSSARKAASGKGTRNGED